MVVGGELDGDAGLTSRGEVGGPEASVVEVGGKPTSSADASDGEQRGERSTDHPELRVGLADIVEQGGAHQVVALWYTALHAPGDAERVVLVHGLLGGEEPSRVTLEQGGDEELITGARSTGAQRAEESACEVRQVAQSHTAARSTQAIQELRNERESSNTKTRAMSTKNP